SRAWRRVGAPQHCARAERGTPPVQGPVADTNVRPVGVGSLRTTPTASDGPALLTVIAYAAVDPAVACAGPLVEICRSASGVTVTALVAMLLSVFGSVTSPGAAIDAVLARTPSVLDAIGPTAVDA